LHFSWLENTQGACSEALSQQNHWSREQKSTEFKHACRCNC
jgi:hypothetical protein